jgi:N utilization substance protein B
MGRRLAREVAMKILYRYEEGDADSPMTMTRLLDGKKYNDADKVFCRTLVETTISNLTEIDREITRVLKNWSYDRISVIDKTILRLGTCEVLFLEDIPPQVSINEAIEIGKKYGGTDSGRFINGVLDAVKKNNESRDNK